MALRHVLRMHRSAIDWLLDLFESNDVFLRYVHTQKQVADLFTNGFSTKGTWWVLLDLCSVYCVRLKGKPAKAKLILLVGMALSWHVRIRGCSSEALRVWKWKLSGMVWQARRMASCMWRSLASVGGQPVFRSSGASVCGSFGIPGVCTLGGGWEIGGMGFGAQAGAAVVARRLWAMPEGPRRCAPRRAARRLWWLMLWGRPAIMCLPQDLGAAQQPESRKSP